MQEYPKGIKAVAFQNAATKRQQALETIKPQGSLRTVKPSVSSLCTALEGIIQETSEQVSEQEAVHGARKVCTLLLTHGTPLTLGDIGHNLGGQAIHNLPLLKRYIDTATTRNWVLTFQKPKESIVFEPTHRLKLIEACAAGKLDEVKRYKAGIHDFNYWLNSITEIHQKNEICPLIAAIESGNKEVVAHVKCQGAIFPPRPDQRNTRSNILHYLAKTNYIRTARSVLFEKSDLLHKKNKKKKTPLDIARSLDNKPMVRLFENKLDPLKKAAPNRCITATQPALTERQETVEILPRATHNFPKAMTLEKVILSDSETEHSDSEAEHSESGGNNDLMNELKDPECCSQTGLEAFDCASEPGCGEMTKTTEIEQHLTSGYTAPLCKFTTEFDELDNFSEPVTTHVQQYENFDDTHSSEAPSGSKPLPDNIHTEETCNDATGGKTIISEGSRQLPPPLTTPPEIKEQSSTIRPKLLLKDFARKCHPVSESERISGARNHFHDHILEAISNQPPPIISTQRLPATHKNTFPVIIVGSTSFEQYVYFQWGPHPLELLKDLLLPEGINKELLQIILTPRDIDLSVKKGFLMEEITHIASKWIKKARSDYKPELGKTRIEKGDESTENNIIIRRVLLLKDKPHPRTEDIIYAVDLSQNSDAQDYNELEIRKNLLIQGIDKFIQSERKFTQLPPGMEERALKAIARLYLLGALETVNPKLNQPTRRLLAGALRGIPYHDSVFHQFAQSFE